MTYTAIDQETIPVYCLVAYSLLITYISPTNIYNGLTSENFTMFTNENERMNECRCTAKFKPQ